MKWFRRHAVRPEIAAEAEQSRQARIAAEARRDQVREQSEQDGQRLADVLRRLNESNGFAELLVREVVRGSG